MKIHQKAHKFKETLEAFLGDLLRGMGRVRQKFVHQFLFGLLKSKSCRLSQIGRALGEKISLKKTIERLSRNLGAAGLWEELVERVSKEGGKRVWRDDYLIVDLSEVVKKYGQKMEYLGIVRDGSEKGKKLEKGYWSLFVVGTDGEVSKTVPLYHEIYSTEAPEFVSENEKIKKALEVVKKGVGENGIVVIDRGGDRGELLEELTRQGWRFVVRSVGKRMVEWKGKRILVKELARKVPLSGKIKHVWLRRTGKVEKEYWYGWVRIKVKGCGAAKLVVVRGEGGEELLLLTNLGRKDGKRWVEKVVKGYLIRGRVEEEIRHIKQSYGEEGLMVRGYERIKGLAGLVLLASYFTLVAIGRDLQRQVVFEWVVSLSQRIYGLKRFPAYALADGISVLLRNTRFSMAKKKTINELPMLPFF